MSRYLSPVLYVLLILVGCVAFISIAGVRIGLFEPSTGFSILRTSVYASLVLSLLSVFSLALCRKEKNISCQRFFVLVLTVSLVYSCTWIAFYIQKSGLPEINDITTDIDAPPVYMNVGYIRKSNENHVDYNEKFSVIQLAHYQDIQPIYTPQKKSAVYSIVGRLVEERKWEVVARYDQVGVIEATARTPIFGFRDDVVIRVTQFDPNQVRVDMRSSSRVGKGGDFGVNVNRVRSFMTDLSISLQATSEP